MKITTEMLLGKNMKQNELKVLAKWYGGIALNLLKNNAWNPDLDSNQLELLKQRFLKEADIIMIEYNKVTSDLWQAKYDIGDSDNAVFTEGKEIKDCDLDAILQHINRSK